MPSPLEHAGTADTWDALDHLVDELVTWSRSSAPPQTFYRETLQRVVEALAAQAVSIWEAEQNGAVPRCRISADSHSDVINSERFRLLAPAVDWSLTHCEALALAPNTSSESPSLPPNRTDSLLLVQPFVVDDVPLGVVVVEQRADVEPDARRGALRFLSTVGDLAADYHRNRQRALFRRRAAEIADLEALLASIYGEIDVRAVAYAAAHEGRRWCDVDRVAVLSFARKSANVLAVAGVESVDRRAESVRKLEQLAALVAEQGRPLRFPDDAATTPAPQVAQALADYVEVAEPRCLEIALLERSAEAEASPPIGLLVVERFGPGAADTSDASVFAERMEVLRRHAGVALANALEIERIPLQRFWRTVAAKSGFMKRRLSKAAFACAVVGLLFGATFLIPARLMVEVSGTLQPRDRREIYAPLDGIVEEILVRHGDLVTAEMPLLRLRKPELELEQARVLGELQTAERRLAALRANRTSGAAGDAAERRRRQELAAEEEQLKLAVAGSQEQLTLLQKQQAELLVRSPISGKVTTWDPERLLAGRPVARGDSLLHVADESGAWTLELAVPQRGYDDVAHAFRDDTVSPVVEFVVATRPEQSHFGKLVRLANAANTSTDAGTRLAGVAEFDRNDVDDEIRRPGASVSARIDCGASSLGTVSTRDLVYYLRTRWWF